MILKNMDTKEKQEVCPICQKKTKRTKRFACDHCIEKMTATEIANWLIKNNEIENK